MRTLHGSIALLLLFITPVVMGREWTPVEAMSFIRSEGPAKALNAFYNDERKWSLLLQGIEAGSRPWCEVAVALFPALDAAPGQELNLAVGATVRRAPKTALLLLAPTYGLDVVCGGPDVDAEEFDSMEEALKELEERKEAVRALREPSLRKHRDACLANLDAAKTPIRHFFVKE